MKELSAFLFEHSWLDPFWTALLVGFCTVDINGHIWLTSAGEEYLSGIPA